MLAPSMQRNIDLQIAPTILTQTVTTTLTPHQGHITNRGIPQIQGYAPRTARNTPQEQGYTARNNAVPQHQEYAPRNNTIPQRQEYAPQYNTSSQHRGYDPRSNATLQHQEHAPQSNPQYRENSSGNHAGSIRPVNEGNGIPMSQPHRGNVASISRSNVYESQKVQDEDDAGLARENSIPRKEIGTSASAPSSTVPASSPTRTQTGHSRQQSTPKPLPSTPAAASPGFVDRYTDPATQPSSILNRSRPIPASPAGLRDAQDVVDRAKSNTQDTQVVETVVPGQCHSQTARQ